MGEIATGRVSDAMVTIPTTHGPDTPLSEIRDCFEDDHFHMALIVGDDERLVTTIERSDLDERQAGATPAHQLGTLTDRTIGPGNSIEDATSRLASEQGRRLAVIDDAGRLLGLLCLKRDGTGYCSNDGVLARAASSGR
jgi:CBS-domain-containing membrane protein